MAFHRITDDVWVSPQITEDDVARAAAQGATLIVNNRPDDEEPGQLSGDRVAAAARAHGLDYVAVPVRGRPDAEAAAHVGRALASASGPALMFCRSGMRSAAAWAMAATATGALDADTARALARDAGYDLSGLPL